MFQFIKYKVIYLIFFFLFVFLNSCGTLKKEKLFKSKGLTISYRSFNRLGPDYVHINPNHPVKISAQEIEAQLKALEYKPFKPRSKLAPVFSKDRVKKVVHLLKKGLNQANQQNYLHFELITPKGMTEGDVFSANGFIHWRIWKINGVHYSNDPLGIRKKTWKLIPKSSGNRYFVSSVSDVKKEKQNWIVVNFDILTKKQEKKIALGPTNENIYI